MSAEKSGSAASEVPDPVIHRIYLYLVDGRAKPSAEALYLKRDERIQWMSGTRGVQFLIKFDKVGGNPFIDALWEEKTPTPVTATTKLGSYEYSIMDTKFKFVVDPSVDVGDPGP